ncbi:hypothetical protein N7517_003636 [Penicillium concentricum]|uniref:Uncharacterized protein n=1 Tax=Penicillium concentricum TaxID=293559 RepID=A0A9W9S4A7_9EURO|nr:uncharacterized protein N7517_003636 [Penicillium concentricum]KAJ5371630.1 hypothetical protein N7517_003636 [Penicillium concentricum]
MCGDVFFQWKPQLDSNFPVDTLRAITHSEMWFDYKQSRMMSTQCYQQLGKEHGISEKEIARMFRHSTGCLMPNPRMTRLLYELKNRGLAIYMMTNIPRIHFDQLRSVEYEWDLFDAIFASGYVGMRKPNRCFYELVLKETSTAALEAIFIDDKNENVLAAEEVGMAGLLYDGTKADEFWAQLMDILSGKATDSMA